MCGHADFSARSELPEPNRAHVAVEFGHQVGALERPETDTGESHPYSTPSRSRRDQPSRTGADVAGRGRGVSRGQGAPSGAPGCSTRRGRRSPTGSGTRSGPRDVPVGSRRDQKGEDAPSAGHPATSGPALAHTGSPAPTVVRGAPGGRENAFQAGRITRVSFARRCTWSWRRIMLCHSGPSLEWRVR